MSTVNPSLNLSQTDFLNLLVTQLQYQDPSNPASSTDFLNQLAELSTVNGISSLNTSFSSLLALQQLTGGTNLVGQTVSYTPSGSTTPTTGVVQALGVSNGAVQLSINGATIPLTSVNGILS